ncbi:hypothetical protein [Actinoplanes sp. NPDC020271]|uniref:hypothetical protein n=1 Tax=Actinoplanes sp. NPDC020271 TaxID=3363896 RepID=UPI00378DE673
MDSRSSVSLVRPASSVSLDAGRSALKQPLTSRVLTTAAILLTAVGVGGCGDAQPNRPAPLMSSSSAAVAVFGANATTTPPVTPTDGQLRAVGPGPTRIPPVALLRQGNSQVKGQIVYRDWLDPHGPTEAQSISREKTAVITTGSSLAIHLAITAEPVQIQVLAHAAVGDNGLPVSETPQYTCEPKSGDGNNPCNYSIGTELVVRFIPESSFKLIILNVAWFVPAGMRVNDEPEAAAAWAFPVS